MLTKQERVTFYKSNEWKVVRKLALTRDNYECQECKRNGKVLIDQAPSLVTKRKRLDVDHVKDLERYPELGLELNNLETLCIKCHNQKHNRFIKKENKWATDEKW
ncbi:gp65 protein [Listeria floridensis FSL S10-1187]|uniref:Putative HNH nuclease YajD n=1 Tax=Listeria floridensis FSL S10-1187 TaxID=1265817 RepID=A0ABP3B0W8_9LIST|nr:HNH endonuclease [Listeria floridensis]EUJ33530.1 gp65 protein [Listeria floridensis FSL S10-1187]